MALPSLLILFPLLLGATAWGMVWGKSFKPALILPTAVFLAPSLHLRHPLPAPDIDYTSDGISDLNMINNFSQGQTLPPPDTWMRPYRFEWYYGLQHYAASVVERLLNIKIGTAYNGLPRPALGADLRCGRGRGLPPLGRQNVGLRLPFPS